VTREVGLDQDLPRRALELLLAGPIEGEAGVDPPLPTATHLRDLRIEGGTAYVELSPEAIREAASVGNSPGNEALALGAVANTLTEFPSVEVVRLTVEGTGVDPVRFWGGWGAPDVLVRDESLIGPSRGGEGLLDLARFATGSQTTGSDDADPVELTAVRVRDRLTHIRVTAELSLADGSNGAVKVPRVRARVSGDALVVAIAGVTDYSATFGARQSLELSTRAFRELRVEHDGASAALRLAVDDVRERPFWLHTLSNPTRVIVDVKK
jgi:hypothetical protein